MNTYVYYVAAFALALFIYFRYMHRDMMGLVDVAKTVADRKKLEPEAETTDLMGDVLVEMDMENLVPSIEAFVKNMDPDKNPVEEIMKMMRLSQIEEPEEQKEDE